jgi:hypothetical protein
MLEMRQEWRILQTVVLCWIIVFVCCVGDRAADLLVDSWSNESALIFPWKTHPPKLDSFFFQMRLRRRRSECLD